MFLINLLSVICVHCPTPYDNPESYTINNNKPGLPASRPSKTTLSSQGIDMTHYNIGNRWRPRTYELSTNHVDTLIYKLKLN